MAIRFLADQSTDDQLTIQGSTTNPLLRLYNTNNGGEAQIAFSDHETQGQIGTIKYVHTNTASYGSGEAFILEGTETTTSILADGKLLFNEGLFIKPSSGTGAGTQLISSAGAYNIPSIVNAGTDTDQFLVRDSSGNVDFRTGAEVRDDIGAGTGSGTVTSVELTGGEGVDVTVTSGANPITGSGNLTLTLDLNELTTTSGSGNADFFAIVNSGGSQFKIAPGNINNSTFNNDAGYTTNTGTIGGSGTADTVAKFTAGTTIGDGPITFSTDDSTFSGNVTIGSNSAAAPRLFFNKAASGTSEIKFNNVGSEKASIQLDSAEDLQIFANTSQKIVLRSGGADTLTLDDSQNAEFEGDVTVNGDFTRVNRLSVTGDVNVIGSTDLTIPQTRKMLFDGSGGHTYMSEESDSNLKLYVAATEVVNFTNDFVSFQKYIDIPNLKISSSQGTSGQVLQSTGSGIQWATISTGGISGSGTSGKVAKFTGSSSIGDGDITFGTNTITLGDPTSSSTATLFVDTQNRRVGYRTINPTSAFEVVGTINTQGLNCNEKQFFSPKNNNYIQAGAYGGGEFFGMTGSENQPKYTYAAGSGGKFVEDERIETVKIEGNGFLNWHTNGCIIIPAQGANTFILVKEITVYKSAGSNSNMGTVYFGFCEQASPTANCQMFGTNHSFDFWAEISHNVTQKSGTWLWQSNRPMSGMGNQNSDVSSRLNRPFVARVSQGSNLSSGTFNGPWYIQVKYSNVNYLAGFVNNADRTVTSTGSSGGSSRTQFLGSSVTNFSTICPGNANVPPDANQSYHFDNSSGCNGNNGYPASGDIVYTSATGSTVASAGYIFLYSGGGSRYYIQIGASGVVQGTNCTDSISECDQPDP